MRYRYLLPFISVILCFGPVLPHTSGAGNYANPFDLGADELDLNSPIEANADELNYDREKGRIIASGNVVITYGSDKLTADKVLVNINTGDAYAVGNVVIKRKGMKDLKGTKVRYNFRNRTSDIDDPEVSVEPFHATAKKVTRNGRNEYVLHDARVTTCNKPYPHTHYSLKAKRVNVVPGEYMKTKGAVLSLGKVPVMYLPFWRKNLSGNSGFRFYPGYRNKMGAFLLSSYYHHPAPGLKAEHHIDYRTERGVGLGEDWDWNTGTAKGKLRLYYIDDDDPMRGLSPESSLNIDSQRYLIHLQHNQNFGPRTLFLLKGSYLSDPNVVDDYFNHAYRNERQPENYASLSYNSRLYTITALANTRLNNFYSNVNRLPEVALNFNRTQIANSSFYYESYTAGSMLEQVWPDESLDEDYSTARFDTKHMIYQPRRYMGWLNLVPRAGYRGTYYSATSQSMATTNITVVTATTNSAAYNQTNVVTSLMDGPAKLRNIFEVGAQASFKAFKTLKGGNMRHMVEPYINYTFSTDPDVEADELYQFDNVDTLREQNNIMLGVRNKLQSKLNGRPHDLVEVNLWTTLEFATEDGEDSLDKLYLDSDFYPTLWMYINIYGNYSFAESVLSELNSRIRIHPEGIWNLTTEHRYRDNDSNLFSGNLTLYPSLRWAFSAFGRYEFEQSRLEEAGGYVEHKVDCIGVRLGGSVLPAYTRTDGSEEEADYRVILSVWLTAFPKMGLGID